MEVKTVFSVKGETYAVQGYGQDAASAIMKQFPLTRIVLVGFMINDKFCSPCYDE